MVWALIPVPPLKKTAKIHSYLTHNEMQIHPIELLRAQLGFFCFVLWFFWFFVFCFCLIFILFYLRNSRWQDGEFAMFLVNLVETVLVILNV